MASFAVSIVCILIIIFLLLWAIGLIIRKPLLSSFVGIITSAFKKIFSIFKKK